VFSSGTKRSRRLTSNIRRKNGLRSCKLLGQSTSWSVLGRREKGKLDPRPGAGKERFGEKAGSSPGPHGTGRLEGRPVSHQFLLPPVEPIDLIAEGSLRLYTGQNCTSFGSLPLDRRKGPSRLLVAEPPAGDRGIRISCCRRGSFHRSRSDERSGLESCIGPCGRSSE
jgi:hypothetical protein